MSSSVNQPKVSLLIAARNEEHHIGSLLSSIAALDYPHDRLEVLIGNDASTDLTENRVAAFIQDKPYIKLFQITPSQTHLRGKANVLAQLADHANGDLLFFTDADIVLPPNWINAMRTHFTAHVGVVVGSTVTSPTSLFARCQGIEWLTVLNLMEFCGRFNIPTTGMGNNMAVTRAAYRAVGGYGALPFSIVEDYALYIAIIKKGFGFKHVFNKEVLTYTQPPENYFDQRKRWVSGGVSSRSPLLVVAFLQALSLPAIVSMFLFAPTVGWLALGLSASLNMALGGLALQKMKLTAWLPYLPLYGGYVTMFWFFQFINYLLPGKISWKDRTY